MKKLLLALLLAAILVAVVACGGADTSAPDTEATPPAETTTEASATTATMGKTTTAKPPVTTKTPATTKAPVVTTVPKPEESLPVYSEGLSYSYDMGKNTYTVTGIGKCTDEVVTVPPTYDGGKVVRIKALACDAKEIIISEGVESIADFAFQNCPKLEKIVLPKTAKSIGNSLFRECPSLKTVEIAEGNPNYFAKNGCIVDKATKTVTSGSAFATIPDDGSVTAIGYTAFAYLPMTSVTVPEGITAIHQYAFTGCKALASVTLPDSLRSIGSQVFEDTALYDNAASWENGMLYIGKHLIEVQDSLTEVTVKDGTLTIAAYAFEWSNATDVSFPSSLKTVGENAFAYAKIKNVVFNEGLVTIESNAFSNSSAETFVIPASVSVIGSGALSSLGLTHIYCRAETIPEGWDVNFNENSSYVTMGYDGE